MSTNVHAGADMRSIYIRSLLLALGLAAFAAIELFAPRAGGPAHAAPVAMGAALPAA